jgi:hypothetical protein
VSFSVAIFFHCILFQSGSPSPQSIPAIISSVALLFIVIIFQGDQFPTHFSSIGIYFDRNSLCGNQSRQQLAALRIDDSFSNEHSSSEQMTRSSWVTLSINFLSSCGFVETSFTESSRWHESYDLLLSEAYNESDLIPISLIVLISIYFSFDSIFRESSFKKSFTYPESFDLPWSVCHDESNLVTGSSLIAFGRYLS